MLNHFALLLKLSRERGQRRKVLFLQFAKNLVFSLKFEELGRDVLVCLVLDDVLKVYDFILELFDTFIMAY